MVCCDKPKLPPKTNTNEITRLLGPCARKQSAVMMLADVGAGSIVNGFICTVRFAFARMAVQSDKRTGNFSNIRIHARSHMGRTRSEPRCRCVSVCVCRVV